MSFALSLLLCVLPQGEGQLAGRVLDAAGKPIEGASVTLLHRPIARHLDASREHRVVVTTESRGTFRASLRDDTRYSAWATTASGASATAEGITVGGFLELRLAPGTGREPLAIAGLEAWPEGATFRYRAVVGSEHLDFAPIERGDAGLLLPSLPPMEHRTIEVLAAGDRILWAGQPERHDGATVLTIPPPANFTVQVTDAAGAPLRDVEILAHVVNYWATQSPATFYGDRFRALWPSQGKTDGEGRLALRLLHPPLEKRRLWLLARKDGYRMSIDGVLDDKPFRNGEELATPPADPQAPIAVVLHAAPPTNVSLRQADGSPFASNTLFVGSRIHVKRAGGGAMGLPFHFPLAVQGGMAVLAAPLPPGAEIETAWTELAPPLRESLRTRLGVAPPRAFRLPLAPRLLVADPPPQIDANEWQALQVVGDDGRPAANTIVQLRPDLRQEGTLVRTDRLGRVAFERRGETRVSVFAPAGLGGMTIAATTKQPATLALRAMHTVKGRVAFGDGKPVAGARIAARVTADADGDLLPAEHYGLSCLLPLPPSTDDGQFELLLPPFAAKVELTVAGGPAGPTVTTTVDWDPAASTKIEVVLARQERAAARVHPPARRKRRWLTPMCRSRKPASQ